MSYRCPLCLKQLNEQHQLTRYCTLHPERKETFHCFPHLIANKIFCSDLNCKSVDQIEEGVFLYHHNCEEPNPFWNGERVAVPGAAGESRVAFEIDFERGVYTSVQVQHWLLGVLRDLPSRTKEMWFPLMLLRATGERNGTSHVGSFIELSGATAAGKTIMAIQAMNPSGYAGGTVNDLKNFIFSRRIGDFKERPFVNFIQTLHLSTLLRRASRDLFLPRGTPPGPRNLRVVFFKPNSFGSAGLAEHDRNWKGYGKRLLRMTWQGSVKFFKTDVRAGFVEIFGSQGFRPYWHSLAFYDKSGEFDENEDVMRDVLDKVAVVVDAQEIFASVEAEAAEKSIQVAVQRLSRGIERKQLCYLVITQLDRVKTLMGEEDWKTVVRLADDLSQVGKDRSWLTCKREMLFPARPSTERQLVEKWLTMQPTENRLRLRDSLRHVEAIFFLWTDNLPTGKKPTAQTKIPVSHGLAKFVCRCMDIEWDQIGSRKA